MAFPAYRQTALFTYIADKWQVTPKLTLDLGLRHEFWPPATPRLDGGFSNYDPTTNTLRVAGIGDNPKNLGRETFYKAFAPRIGVSYRFDSKTVIRAGFGISWIPFPDNQYAYNFPIKHNNGFNNRTAFGQAVLPDGSFGSMATGFPAPQPPVIPSNGIIDAGTPLLLSQSFNIIPKDYREGYVESWNFAIQRALPNHFTIEASYVANHTVRAPVAFNINHSQTVNSGAAGRPLVLAFNKNQDSIIRYVGYSNNYNSLQVKLDRRWSSGFVLTTAYTYGKALGYSSEDGGLPYYINQRRSYSPLDFSRTQTLVQSYVYELPFGRNKRWFQSGVGRWVLGDWQVNGVLTAMTGTPLNFGTNVSINSPGNGNSPDITGPVKVLHGIAGPRGTALWFDTSNFSRPLDADGRTPHFGNVGRGILTGPGLRDLDISLFRKFSLTERVAGEFRVESFNVTNTPNFGNPNTTHGDANFGRVTGVRDPIGAGGVGPRVIQLGLKLTFKI